MLLVVQGGPWLQFISFNREGGIVGITGSCGQGKGVVVDDVLVDHGESPGSSPNRLSFSDCVVVEEDVGWRHVIECIGDFDGEGLHKAQATGISRLDPDRVHIPGVAVEGFSRLEFVPLDCEGCVVGVPCAGGQGKGVCVSRVRVDHGEVSGGCPDWLVLDDDVIVEQNAGGGLVFSQISDIDRKDLLEGKPAGIGHLDPDGVLILGVVVEGFRRLEFFPLDGEGGVVSITGAGGQGKGVCVVGFRVDCGEGSGYCPYRLVLGDGVAVDGDVGGCAVFRYIRDVDGEGLFEAQAPGVGHLDPDGVLILGLVVEGFSCLELFPVDCEGCVVGAACAGGQGEGVCVIGVRVDCREGAGGGPDRLVLGDGVAVEGDVCWCSVFRYISNIDGEGLFVAQPRRVSHFDADGVFTLGLMVEGFSCLELFPVDCEGCVIGVSCAGGQGKGVGVIGVRVDHGEGTGGGPYRLVFCNGVAIDGDVGGDFIDIIHSQRDILLESGSSLVGGTDPQGERGCGLCIEGFCSVYTVSGECKLIIVARSIDQGVRQLVARIRVDSRKGTHRVTLVLILR